MANVRRLSKDEFYRGKTVTTVEWWLERVHPDIHWARLRVFSDGTADASFADGAFLYGFDTREYASYFLGEDEYVRFAIWQAGDRSILKVWDAEDEQDHQLRVDDVQVPHWADPAEPGFKYFGVY